MIFSSIFWPLIFWGTKIWRFFLPNTFGKVNFVFSSVNLTSFANFGENSIWGKFAKFFIFQN